MTIVAAADGSALGNPGPAGWAWYVDDTAWAAGGWPHGTNNQGELMAVIDLLESTSGESDDLQIVCDSQYVINAVTKWMPAWKRKGWRKADGKPVLNRELLERLDDALTGRLYRFEWVKGHAGHDLNEAADQRARAVATAYQNGAEIPCGPGWPHNPANPTRVAREGVPAQFAEEPSDESDLDVVVRLERELLDPAVRADQSRLAVLLHPDFEEIGRSGRLWGRDTLIEALGGEADEEHTRLEVLEVAQPVSDAVLLTLRTTNARGATLRSSLWVRDHGSWRIRFHQGTPEAE